MKGLKGSATLEILLATVVIMCALTAVIGVVFGNQSAAADTAVSAEALALAEQGLEDARAAARTDFNLLVAAEGAATSGPLMYQTALTVTQTDLFTKQATSTVSWSVGGLLHSVTLSTLLANLDAVGGSAPTCSSVLTGNWRAPRHYEWDLGALGINGGDGAGFGISNLHAFNSRLYVTLYAATSTFNNTLLAFDVSHAPERPVYLGSIDNDPGSGAGPNAVSVGVIAGKTYAFLAGAGRGAMQIVDATDPAHMQLVASYRIPTGIVPTAGTPLSIFYRSGYVYLGLSKITSGGDEFDIIDVHDPAHPVWKGGYDTGGAINQMYAHGSRTYLASAAAESLVALDVTDGTHPVRVGGFTPTTTPESEGIGSDHGESVFAVGPTTYFGRTYGSNEFYMFDAEHPAQVKMLGSQDVGTGKKTSIYGLVVRDTLAFMLTLSQFQIWDISHPGLVTPWTTDGTAAGFLSLADLGGSGTAMDCEGNTIYAAISSPGAVPQDKIAIIMPS